MEALKQNICIPENHHIHLDFTIPASIPAGEAEVLLVVQPKSESKPFQRVSGSAKGLVLVSDDFDSPLPKDLLDGFYS